MRQVEALREKDPARARLLVETARLSIGWSGSKADWIDSALAETPMSRSASSSSM